MEKQNINTANKTVKKTSKNTVNKDSKTSKKTAKKPQAVVNKDMIRNIIFVACTLGIVIIGVLYMTGIIGEKKKPKSAPQAVVEINDDKQASSQKYDDSKFINNGMVMWYDGELDKNAEYYLDDEKITAEIIRDGDRDMLVFNNEIPEGLHKLVIENEAKETYVHEFMWKKPVFTGLFARENGDNAIYVEDNGKVYILLNPEYEGKTVTCNIGDKEYKTDNAYVNGDGYLVAAFDTGTLKDGVYDVTVNVEGADPETLNFIVGEDNLRATGDNAGSDNDENTVSQNKIEDEKEDAEQTETDRQ